MQSFTNSRCLLAIVLVAAFTCTGFAAVPGLMSYQGMLKSSGGIPVNGTYSIKFSIYDVASGGVALWSETQGAVAVKDGNFAVNLGSVSSLNDGIFQAATRYLGVKVGADPELSPRRRFSSAGYAFRVNTIDGATGGSIQGDASVNGNSAVNGNATINGNTQITGYATVANYLTVNNSVTSTAITPSGTANIAISGESANSPGINVGVYGVASDASSNPSVNCAGIYGHSMSFYGGTIWAGYFDGWVNVAGNFYSPGKFFKIDDPQRPAERTLTHSCVESDEYKNIYDGEVILNDQGEATVTLPDWFDALNTEFRYQLTCVGGYAPVYISSKLANNQFTISGGKPGLEISWQVTGVRKDAYAVAHPFKVVEDKPAELRGKYLHPTEQGVSEELGVDYAMRKYSEEQLKSAAARKDK